MIAQLITWNSNLLAAQELPPSLNPQIYRSPSGKYSLYINPNNRYGCDSGSYQFSKDGQTIWSGEMSFTLWKADVTDSGIVAGYSYTKGLAEFCGSRFNGFGELRFLIIDPAGNIRLDQSMERKNSRFLHTFPDPIVSGIIVDEENDRFVVRIADEDINRRQETWWVYSLATGKFRKKFAPKALMAKAKSVIYLIDAKSLPGTSFTLLHWWCVTDKSDVGARFTLIDLDGNVVWFKDLPKDYTIPGDEKAEDRLRDTIREKGAILSTDKDASFDLWFVSQSQRVKFRVKSSESGSWKVTEIDRQSYTPNIINSNSQVKIAKTTLNYLGRIVLPNATMAVSKIRDVRDFVMVGRDKIAFLRAMPSEPPILFVVDYSGNILQEVNLVSINPESEEREWSGYAWVGGSRFIVTVSNIDENGRASAWWVDADTKMITPLRGFDCPAIERIVAFPDGGFAALTTTRAKYTSKEDLYTFNVQGKPAWSLVRDFGYGPNEGPEQLFSPDDIAVTTEGKVVVLDNIRKTIQVFDRNGSYVKTIDLKKAWGREPNYPTDIAADTDGGFIVHDFHGSFPIVRMTAEGLVRSEIAPKFSDGSTFDILDNVKVGNDGHLWTCDSYSLLKLTDTGVVDKVIGPAPDKQKLERIDALAIDRRGRILALDERTKSVHVFDPTGKPLFVARPRATDFPKDVLGLDITVAQNGDFYVEDKMGDRAVRFSVDGKYLGLQIVANVHESEPSPSDMESARWVKGRLVSPSGKVLRSFDRRPDDTWMETIINTSVASDGSVAILDRKSWISTDGFVSLFSPVGIPLRVIILPSLLTQVQELTYDGKQLVFISGKQVVGISTTGEILWRATPRVKQAKEPYWYAFITDQGTVLSLFDSYHTIYRYRLPIEGTDQDQKIKPQRHKDTKNIKSR
jgi:hypothetical protein